MLSYELNKIFINYAFVIWNLKIYVILIEKLLKSERKIRF